MTDQHAGLTLWTVDYLSSTVNPNQKKMTKLTVFVFQGASSTETGISFGRKKPDLLYFFLFLFTHGTLVRVAWQWRTADVLSYHPLGDETDTSETNSIVRMYRK